MKTNEPSNAVELESGSIIILHEAHSSTSYPIPSISGCGKQGAQRGWIFREIPVDTLIFRLSPVDALNGGFAIPVNALADLIHRSDKEFAVYQAEHRRMSETIQKMQRKNKRLETKITQLEHKTKK
jgi:hypothetical protein